MLKPETQSPNDLLISNGLATIGGYKRALREALRGECPALIDAMVDPAGYPEQLSALRG